ncbi:MAG: DUF1501 domain-containing protein [Planctomycetota bacterium]
MATTALPVTPSAISRRGLLDIGRLSVGGLSLAHVMGLRRAAGASVTRPQKSVILLWMAGGPSHIDLVDMKPQAAAEVRGPFQPIATTLPGLEVCELLPGHATVARHLTVIRSLTHTFSVHDDAQHLVQTGYPQLNARQAGQQHPCQGSVVSYSRGSSATAGLPAYLCVPEDYRTHVGFYQTAAFLSARHNALNAGGDPRLGNFRPPAFDLPAGINRSRFQDRRSLTAALDRFPAQVGFTPALQDALDVQQQAAELVAGQSARQAFDLSDEPAALRDRYGRHSWGQYMLLARRLVQAGAGFVTVNLYEKDVDWWDDHSAIENNLRKRLPMFDQAFAALIQDLHEQRLLDEVLVVACGEFGRTPRIDSAAGRGHWPRAMHAVLSGGGIRSGQIIGSTTRDGGEPHTRPLTPGDLLASIYRVVGVDPNLVIPDRQQRPVPVLAEGSPIRELF